MEEALVKSIRAVEPKHWWFQARRTIAREIIRTQVIPALGLGSRPPRILDAGAGTGFMAESLADFGDVDALEFDPTSLEALRTRRGVNVVEGMLPAEKIADGTYDLVTSFDVLEHIEEDAAALREMGRVLRPGGLVLVTVPAHPYLWSQHDEANDHFRRYRAGEFRQKAASSGMRLEYFSPHLSVLFPLFLIQRLLHQIFPPREAATVVSRPPAVLNWLFYVLYAIEGSLLRRRVHLPFGASYIALLRKPLENEEMEENTQAPRELAAWDPRRVLAIPKMYSLFRAMVTGTKEHVIFAREYVRAKEGDRVLDIGCGPADLLGDLPEKIEYVGFDMSAEYIESAKARWGERGTFTCKRVDDAMVEELGAGSFDIVLAHGLLHHLDDKEAVAFFALAKSALKPGGRLVTLDGCYVPDQSRAARYLLSKDRGNYVRDRESYLKLAAEVFDNVEDDIRHDMYRIPYTLILLQCHA